MGATGTSAAAAAAILPDCILTALYDDALTSYQGLCHLPMGGV